METTYLTEYGLTEAEYDAVMAELNLNQKNEE